MSNEARSSIIRANPSKDEQCSTFFLREDSLGFQNSRLELSSKVRELMARKIITSYAIKDDFIYVSHKEPLIASNVIILRI